VLSSPRRRRSIFLSIAARCRLGRTDIAAGIARARTRRADHPQFRGAERRSELLPVAAMIARLRKSQFLAVIALLCWCAGVVAVFDVKPMSRLGRWPPSRRHRQLGLLWPLFSAPFETIYGFSTVCC